jgi:peptidoglycan/LPS O-acetylase OafA/YrhL
MSPPDAPTKVGAPPVTAPTRHLAHVDGLRGCAALFVMFHHMFQGSRNVEHPGVPRFLFMFQHGHFAVSLFIVISGFSLMFQVLRANGEIPGGASAFYLRRARRILPPYYWAMLLSLAVTAAGIHTFSVPLTRVGVLAHALLLQDVVPEARDQVNFVFWSIAVELHIYVLFPWLVMLWRRFGGAVVTMTTALVGYLLSYAARGSRCDGMHLNYLALFAMGMAAAAIAAQRGSRSKWLLHRVPWLLVAAAATAPVAVACYFLEFAPTRTCDIGIGVLGVALIVGPLVPSNVVLRSVLGWKPLSFVGTFAYSVYLVHMPLLGIFRRSGLVPASFGEDATFAFLIAVASAPILLGCYGFYRICELPFIRSRKRSALVRSTGSEQVGETTTGQRRAS